MLVGGQEHSLSGADSRGGKAFLPIVLIAIAILVIEHRSDHVATIQIGFGDDLDCRRGFGRKRRRGAWREKPRAVNLRATRDRRTDVKRQLYLDAPIGLDGQFLEDERLTIDE